MLCAKLDKTLLPIRIEAPHSFQVSPKMTFADEIGQCPLQ